MNKRREIEGKTKNISRAFILPMVGINYTHLPSNFVNCYITDDYRVVLVFDKTEGYDEDYAHFLGGVKHSRHIDQYDELDDEIIISFKIPDICKYDYDLFKDGKYSKFTEPYKQILCRFFGKKTIKENHTVTEYNAIYPEDFKRKQIADHLEVDVSLIDEVLHKPNLDKEVFRPIDVLKAQNITE